MQSRLTQEFTVTLKRQKLGGQLSRRKLQTKQQLFKGRPGTDGLHQRLVLVA